MAVLTEVYILLTASWWSRIRMSHQARYFPEHFVSKHLEFMLLSERDRISCSHKTSGKMTVLYVLNLYILKNRQDEDSSELNDEDCFQNLHKS